MILTCCCICSAQGYNWETRKGRQSKREGGRKINLQGTNPGRRRWDWPRRSRSLRTQRILEGACGSSQLVELSGPGRRRLPGQYVTPRDTGRCPRNARATRQLTGTIWPHRRPSCLSGLALHTASHPDSPSTAEGLLFGLSDPSAFSGGAPGPQRFAESAREAGSSAPQSTPLSPDVSLWFHLGTEGSARSAQAFSLCLR